jgi:hypothetical protein
MILAATGLSPTDREMMEPLSVSVAGNMAPRSTKVKFRVCSRTTQPGFGRQNSGLLLLPRGAYIYRLQAGDESVLLAKTRIQRLFQRLQLPCFDSSQKRGLAQHKFSKKGLRAKILTNKDQLSYLSSSNRHTEQLRWKKCKVTMMCIACHRYEIGRF